MTKKLKKLDGEPIILNEHAWYYTEKKGITVVAEMVRAGISQGTTVTVIPWRKLAASLKHYQETKE